ncbi:glycosyl hydrolase [Paenibacillus tritici]|nr:glycosyl hydrolase [Paenibacillus tritici]
MILFTLLTNLGEGDSKAAAFTNNEQPSVIQATYADAVLNGYGIEKRGPVYEDHDQLYDGDGYISFFFAENASSPEEAGNATFKVNAPEAGLYKLSIGYYIPEGYGGKATGIQVNGTGAGELMLDAPAAGTVRAEKMVSKVLLNAGENTIKITRGWGYYGIEFILLEPANAQAAGNLLEAEEGMMSGSVSIGADGSGYSGDGYAAFQQSGSLTLNYKAPAAGMFDILIRYSSPNGEKKTSIVLNGNTTEITLPETAGYKEIPAGKAWLKEGDNVIEFLANWGWYNIDYVKLTAAAAPERPVVSTTLINPDASPEARSLMNFLDRQYGRKLISGQQTLEDAEWIFRQTGKYPAILATDVMDYSPSRVEKGATSTEIEKIIAWHKRGGIISLCWHWNAPKGIGGEEPGHEWYKGFYTDYTTFDVEYALNHPDSEDYQLLLRDMDAIAFQLKRLQDAGVPVLWRPLHEAEGGWFWWGAKGPEPAKQLWRLMYDRLTNHHHLNNLIWVWNSEKPEWYPGDDIVDIASIDIYNPAGDYNPSIAKYESLVSLVNGRKVIGLAENGPIPDPEMLQAYSAHWSFFTTWTGSFIKDGITNSPEHLKKVYEHDNVVTLDELPPDLYSSQKHEPEKEELPDWKAINHSGSTVDKGKADPSKTQVIQVDGAALIASLRQQMNKPAESQLFVIQADKSEAAEFRFPASALVQAAAITPDAAILIEWDTASYRFPVALINAAEAAEHLGAQTADVQISLQMRKLGSRQAEEISMRAKDKGVRLDSEMFELKVLAYAGEQSFELNHFGSRYISHTFTIPQSAGNGLTAVGIDPATGELSFVPAVTQSANGATVITIKRNGGGIYTTGQPDRMFDDLRGHWAKEDIEFMANKLLVHGMDAHHFAPDQYMTRAEFIMLMARALGLQASGATAPFSDVPLGKWYTGAIAGAHEAGLITGYPDGTFRPDAWITRQQMTDLIDRAAAVAGHTMEPAQAAPGLTPDQLAVQDRVDRAQAVVMIKRLLMDLNLINP